MTDEPMTDEPMTDEPITHAPDPGTEPDATSGDQPTTELEPPSDTYGWDETGRIERLSGELRDAIANLPEATMVLFSGPAPDIDSADARQNLAAALAEHAGLGPWPEWAAARHGPGHGGHLLNLVDELGHSGRTEGVVVVLLAPIEPCLLSHAGAVAVDNGLELVVVGDLFAS